MGGRNRSESVAGFARNTQVHQLTKGMEPAERAKMELSSKRRERRFPEFIYISVGWGGSRTNFNNSQRFVLDEFYIRAELHLIKAGRHQRKALIYFL